MTQKLRQLLALILLISGMILQSTGIAEEGLPDCRRIHWGFRPAGRSPLRHHER